MLRGQRRSRECGQQSRRCRLGRYILTTRCASDNGQLALEDPGRRHGRWLRYERSCTSCLLILRYSNHSTNYHTIITTRGRCSFVLVHLSDRQAILRQRPLSTAGGVKPHRGSHTASTALPLPRREKRFARQHHPCASAVVLQWVGIGVGPTATIAIWQSGSGEISREADGTRSAGDATAHRMAYLVVDESNTRTSRIVGTRSECKAEPRFYKSCSCEAT